MADPIARLPPLAGVVTSSDLRLAWRADSEQAEPSQWQSDDPQSRLSADDLFSELNGRALQVVDERWSIEVYSITDHGQRRWVQVGLQGLELRIATVRTGINSGVPSILGALCAWLSSPPQCGAILNVA